MANGAMANGNDPLGTGALSTAVFQIATNVPDSASIISGTSMDMSTIQLATTVLEQDSPAEEFLPPGYAIGPHVRNGSLSVIAYTLSYVWAALAPTGTGYNVLFHDNSMLHT